MLQPSSIGIGVDTKRHTFKLIPLLKNDFMKTVYALVMFVTFIFYSNISWAQSTDAELHSSESETMRPRNYDSEFYNELWTYHIKLDNGFQIIYAFTITNFGKYKERVTGCKFQTTWKDGKHYVVRKEYDPEDFIYNQKQNMIRLHPDRNYYAKGKFDDQHKLFFKTTKDGVSYFADITISDMAKPQMLGDGTFTVDGKDIELSFPIPHGNVSANLAINGDTLKNIRGTVYMDHLVQTDLGVNIFKNGYRFKSGDAEHGIVGNFLKPKDEGQISGYGISYKNGQPKPFLPVSQTIISEEEIRGTKIPADITFQSQDDRNVQLSIDNVLFVYSILDEIGGFKSFFAKKIMGGELIQFNGTGTTGNNREMIFNYFYTE